MINNKPELMVNNFEQHTVLDAGLEVASTYFAVINLDQNMLEKK